MNAHLNEKKILFQTIQFSTSTIFLHTDVKTIPFQVIQFSTSTLFSSI